ncbi:sensor histidine kinase [Planomonospora sp. ID91781]|uniref:Two-component system histidine kinase n=1 Tax=Planomonospora sphaerica TaxID=161355 RepID=A0A161MEW1_9ACTN|nr:MULTISPECIES: histidine kinase [Planomonospora]MBG0822756.1 sensor histidine kinase [Planomonospora sp. ID91781]GAT70683.1 two-component system histidine kinase [Planomonospora sphaerica]
MALRDDESSDGEEPGYDREAVHAEVVASYRSLLSSAGSVVLSDETVVEQLVRQAGLVVDDVLARRSGAPPEEDALSLPLSMEIGATRAQQGVHPTQSLLAAALMFEAAFPVLARRLAARDDLDVQERTVTIGLDLQRAIMVRLAVGSVPYVNFLLAKLLSAHQDERHRIARDLHDRIAHGMGVALQQLDLYEVYQGDDPERAAANLAMARQAINEGLQGTRRLSADLWERVGDDSLEAALGKYLRITVPRSTRTTLTTTGGEPSLPWEVREEIYILLREAVRNALLHSGTAEIHVEVEGRDGVLRAAVSDRGCGFDVTATRAARSGGGLTSMRERAALLGGTVNLSSRVGEGTTVEVLVPLGEDPALGPWSRPEAKDAVTGEERAGDVDRSG